MTNVLMANVLIELLMKSIFLIIKNADPLHFHWQISIYV